MRKLALATTALAASILAGCGDDSDTGFSHYFSANRYNDPACDLPDPRLSGRREIRIFTQGVDAPVFTRGLQRYYRRYGLTFFSTEAIQLIDQKYALDTDEYDLNQALAKEFPGVDLADPDALMMKDPALYRRVMKVVMNFTFRPIIEFARAHPAGPQVTNLILLPQILRPGGGGISTGGEVAGLAISPALLRRFDSMDIPEGAAWKELDLPADFTPMMFLDGQVLGELLSAAPVLVDLVAAHEFGHTGGLIHRQESHNLMLPAVAPGQNSCLDSLDDDQIDTMRDTLGVAPAKALVVKGERADPLAQLRQVLPPSDLGAILRGDRPALDRFIRHFVE